MKKKLQGCFPALITPIQETGDRLNAPINFDAFKQLIEFVLENKVSGIVPSGCTGHACSLTNEEQLKLIRFARENVKESIPVIAGDGSNSTRDAIFLAKEIENIGISTHLQISPYQNKPTQEGLYQHYAAIANAIEGEIIVYNVPGRTGKNIEAETTIRLAKEFSNIIGVKEASGDIKQIRKIIDGTKDSEFSVISGDDPLSLEIIKSGGTGTISVAANVTPKLFSEMHELAFSGKFDEAEKINTKLKELYRVLFIETNPSPAHYALKKMGIPAGVPRLPLVDLMPENAKQVENCLKELEIIK